MGSMHGTPLLGGVPAAYLFREGDFMIRRLSLLAWIGGCALAHEAPVATEHEAPLCGGPVVPMVDATLEPAARDGMLERLVHELEHVTEMLSLPTTGETVTLEVLEDDGALVLDGTMTIDG